MSPSALDLYFVSLDLPTEVTLIVDQALSSGSGWTALRHRRPFCLEATENSTKDRWKAVSVESSPVCYYPRSKSLSQLEMRRIQERMEEDEERNSSDIIHEHSKPSSSSQRPFTRCNSFTSDFRSHSVWDSRIQPRPPSTTPTTEVNETRCQRNNVTKQDTAPVVPRRWCSSNTKPRNASPPRLRSLQDDKLSVDRQFLLNGSRGRSTSATTPSNESNHYSEEQEAYRVFQLDRLSPEGRERGTRVVLPKRATSKPQTKTAKTA